MEKRFFGKVKTELAKKGGLVPKSKTPKRHPTSHRILCSNCGKDYCICHLNSAETHKLIYNCGCVMDVSTCNVVCPDHKGAIVRIMKK
jgi:hypothetical protein